MENSVYLAALTWLDQIVGGREPLDSGNGCRFRGRGHATAYHENIMAGNSVEIAFSVESFSEVLGLDGDALVRFFRELRELTGRPVNVNPAYEWPRVGCASLDDIAAVFSRF